MLASSTSAETRSDALLDAQRSVLEMIVRGRALREVLNELCLLVEAQSERPVRAAILLVDAEGRHLTTGAAPSLPAAYTQAVDGIAIAPDFGTCCAAAARGVPVVTRDFGTDPGWATLRHLPLAHGLRAAWSMPILSSSGSVLGTFGTYYGEPSEPLPQERRLVEVLARTAALAIERQRADEVLRGTGSRHRFLAELAAATQPLVEVADVMTTTARMLLEHLGVDRCAYAEVEDESVFVITGDYAPRVPSIVGRWPVAGFGPECVSCMRRGEPFVVHDVAESIDPLYRPAYLATSIGAVICVPLHKEGRFTAAMAVHQQASRRWLPEEVELVSRVVARCWEALERARVTRDLSRSEARYRAMIEASPECVKLVGQDGTLLQMNAAGLRMVEASDERSALGRCIYEVIAAEHRARFRAFNERVCGGEGGTLEFEIVGLSGTRRTMETTAVPLATSDGGYAQLAVTRDVTERVAAERALAESRARLDFAVRVSGVGFWYCDLPFDELIWDARVREHFFVPLDARVTMDTFYARMHPDDRVATKAAIDASIEERRAYDVVYRTIDPEGSGMKWVRALGGTGYASDGSPVRFDGVTVDVTAQRRNEEQLARALERERAQARLLEQVAQAALTIHASSSLDAVLRIVTEEARAIIGAHEAVTTLTTPDEDAPSTCYVASADAYEARREPSVAPEVAVLAALVRRAHKAQRWTREELSQLPAFRSAPASQPRRGILAVPLVARDGASLGVVQLVDRSGGAFDEIDEAILVQLAQIAAVALENARLYDQLREQDRRKNEFLAMLAHELRNPLAPLRTGLEVLRSGPSEAQAHKAHAMMSRQLGHTVRLVDDLLDLSRVTLGKVTLQKQRIDFRAIVDLALEATRPLIEAAGHTLRCRLPAGPLSLEVDPTRLAQVLSNLLNNAAKYTPPGGHIELGAEVRGTSLVVSVRDDGVGIPPEMVASVFDMFTQVGGTIERSQGGLGIGLTLVRRFVAMHGGTVEAESEGVGRGTTFTVCLPLAADAASQAVREATAGASEALRILVVDDNEDAAESLAMLLELSGHATALAHSGPDALASVREFRPEVVFLDIGLPGLSGYEVATRIRADTTLAQPLLVALTGWGTEDDRREAHRAGFDRHLVKPFDTRRLAELLASAPRFDAGAATQRVS